MKTDRLFTIERVAAFLVVCVLAFATGITPGELVWGLFISSMVAGSVALFLPLAVLLFNPALEEKLFPNRPPPDFSISGRIFACLFVAMVFVGPFLFFMALFTPFLIDRIPIEGMPPANASWWAHYVWALNELWLLTLVVTAFATVESTQRLYRGDGSAFLRPWVIVLKMFAIVVLSNFGWGTWSIVPLVALHQLPEDFLARRWWKSPSGE